MLQAHCDWFMDERCAGDDWRTGINYFQLRGSDERGEPDTFLWDGQWQRLPPAEAGRLFDLANEIAKSSWNDGVFWIDTVALAWFSGQPWETVE